MLRFQCLETNWERPNEDIIALEALDRLVEN